MGTPENSSADQFPHFNEGTITVVFIELLSGFNESISHKRHQAILAEIIRTVRITVWLLSGRRQESWSETVIGRQHWKGARPLAKVFSFHLGW